MQISIKVDTRAVERMLRITESAVQSATAAALNDTANAVRGAAVKAIAAETGMKQTDIRQRLWIKRATRAGLIAEVGALPSARNVGRYAKANPHQTAAGVQLTAWKRRQTYQGTFVMGGRKGGGQDAAVWRRTGKADRAVSPVIFGPSVRASFRRLESQHALVVQQRFPVFFDRRLRGALIRAGLSPSGSSVAEFVGVLPG